MSINLELTPVRLERQLKTPTQAELDAELLFVVTSMREHARGEFSSLDSNRQLPIRAKRAQALRNQGARLPQDFNKKTHWTEASLDFYYQA